MGCFLGGPSEASSYSGLLQGYESGSTNEEGWSRNGAPPFVRRAPTQRSAHPKSDSAGRGWESRITFRNPFPILFHRPADSKHYNWLFLTGFPTISKTFPYSNTPIYIYVCLVTIPRMGKDHSPLPFSISLGLFWPSS